MEVLVIRSVTLTDTYYIFRGNGQEIRFCIIDGRIVKQTHFITREEREFIKEYIMRNYGG